MVRKPKKPIVEPDVGLNAWLMRDGHKLAKCDCNIWLPKNARDAGAIEIGTFDTAMDFGGPLELKGESPEGWTIHAHGVWISRVSKLYWHEEKNTRSTMDVDHIDSLTIVRKIMTSSSREETVNEGASADPGHLWFHLTDSRYVFVGGGQMQYPNGSIRVINHRSMNFKHPMLGPLRIDRHHHFSKGENPYDTYITSQLAIELRGKIRKNLQSLDNKAARTYVDDVCLILSFAARHRVLVTGHTRYDQGVLENTYDSPLQSINPESSESGWGELIERSETIQFLTRALARFDRLPETEQRAIRHALYPLVPARQPYLEASFVSMFSAFEGLLEPYRDKNGIKHTVGTSRSWKTIEKRLRKAIDEIDISDPAFNRSLMKDRLPELRYIPLHAVAHDYLKELMVPVDDLWPAFGKPGETATLYSIRNSLAHGEPTSGDIIEPLSLAQFHLRILLERVVLALLGWDIDKSHASPDRVKRRGHVGFEDFEMQRDVLREK